MGERTAGTSKTRAGGTVLPWCFHLVGWVYGHKGLRLPGQSSFSQPIFCLCLLVGLGYMGDSKETRELQQWCPATPEVLRQPSPPLQVPEFS